MRKIGNQFSTKTFERHQWRFVVFLLLIHISLSTWSAWTEGLTSDELAHLPAGYSYLKTGDYRLNYEHPPLVKLLAGFPLLFLDINSTAFESPAWNKGNEGEWDFGNIIMFHSMTDVDTILFAGRLPIILLSALLGLVIFLFAKDLFGIRAALGSLALYVLFPEALAHSHYVTTDIGIALGLIATVYFWHHYSTAKKTLWLAITGVTAGLCMSAKFTGIYIWPILGLLFLIQHRKTGVRNILLTGLKIFIPLLIIASFTLAATYKFDQLSYYIDGFTYVIEHSTGGRYAYLLGDHSTQGWWWYFPFAFLVKIPLTYLLLLGLFLSTYLTGIEEKSKLGQKNTGRYLLLFIPAAFYFMTFVLNDINIGIRHIFPIFPFLFIALGLVATEWKKLFWTMIVIQAIITLLIAPHFLSYFSEIIGGSANGYKYLLDSNLDWGQDLKGFVAYQNTNNLQPLYLAYFGGDNATERGIAFEDAPCYPKNGYYAISVNHLVGLKESSSRCFSWLKPKDAFHKIGHTIYLFNITHARNETLERENYCRRECNARCEDANLRMKSSLWDQKCKCSCVK